MLLENGLDNYFVACCTSVHDIMQRQISEWQGWPTCCWVSGGTAAALAGNLMLLSCLSVLLHSLDLQQLRCTTGHSRYSQVNWGFSWTCCTAVLCNHTTFSAVQCWCYLVPCAFALKANLPSWENKFWPLVRSADVNRRLYQGRVEKANWYTGVGGGGVKGGEGGTLAHCCAIFLCYLGCEI